MDSEIFLGDCLSVMEDLSDNSIDMVFCDLPYGTTQNKWDNVIPFDKLWSAYNRVVKENGAIVLTSQQPFTSQLIMSNPSQFRYEWIWEKNKATGHLNAKKMPMKAHENILIFYRKLPTYNPQKTEGKPYTCKRRSVGYYNQPREDYTKNSLTENKGDRHPSSIIDIENTILEYNNPHKTIHRTQKPVDLLEWLIKTYSNENNTVMDFCMGSGTAGVACKNLNRKFIGVEKDKEIFKMAKERIFK